MLAVYICCQLVHYITATREAIFYHKADLRLRLRVNLVELETHVSSITYVAENHLHEENLKNGFLDANSVQPAL
jgi:hypothetical protein